MNLGWLLAGSFSTYSWVHSTYHILAQYPVANSRDPPRFCFPFGRVSYKNYCTKCGLIRRVELREEENWKRGITVAYNQQWVEEVEEDTIAILQFFRLRVVSFKSVRSYIFNLLWFNQYLAILSIKFSSFGGTGFWLCDLICYCLRNQKFEALEPSLLIQVIPSSVVFICIESESFGLFGWIVVLFMCYWLILVSISVRNQKLKTL